MILRSMRPIFPALIRMMSPDSNVEKIYRYVDIFDFRKTFDGLVAIAELYIKIASFGPRSLSFSTCS